MSHVLDPCRMLPYTCAVPAYHYPIPKECLPHASQEREITGYRLGKSTAANMQNDFIPQLFDPASMHRHAVKNNLCKHCGASMFTTRALAIETRNNFLRNRDSLILVSLDCAKHGPVRYEPDNPRVDGRHFDWYQFQDVAIADILQSIEAI